MTPHTIAVVAPSERIRERIAKRLSDAGLGVVHAAADAQGIVALQPGGPLELAIVDIDHDGAEDLSVLESIRDVEIFRQARFLLMTASRRLDPLEITLGNVCGVLVKPFCFSVFVDTVSELLGEAAPLRTDRAACSDPREILGGDEARKGLSVLLVDDSFSMRRIVKDYLAQMGLGRVSSASNFDEACGLLDSDRFGLILSDLRMPGRSGLDLLDKVRSDPRHGATPFVFMSSECGYETVFQTGRRGASAFLPKPFTQEGLKRAVTAALADP